MQENQLYRQSTKNEKMAEDWRLAAARLNLRFYQRRLPLGYVPKYRLYEAPGERDKTRPVCKEVAEAALHWWTERGHRQDSQGKMEIQGHQGFQFQAGQMLYGLTWQIDQAYNLGRGRIVAVSGKLMINVTTGMDTGVWW